MPFMKSKSLLAAFSLHHVVPSQKHDVAVEVFADVRIGLHDSLDVVSWIPLASLPMKLG